MKCLKSKIRLSWMLHVTRELQRQTLTSRTFSSLAPPCETSSDTSCSCFTRWLKSVIHWMTVQPRGTV
jgi:hypothetical protein